jgi:YidC/Oxa1 family membrane protein insertase
MVGPKQTAILKIASYANIRTVALVLIAIMCVTTFLTQKQISKRSGPVEGQAATVQKLMLYGMPLSLFVSGFFFPIGVLIYWVTNNAWTFGQQFFILRKMPPPGSAAHAAKTAGDKPAVDPRTLAPKPGAKPVRPKPGRPAGTTSLDESTGTGTNGTTGTSDTGNGAKGPSAHGPSASGPSANGSGPNGASASGSGGTTGSSGKSGRSGPAGQGPANRGKRKRR